MNVKGYLALQIILVHYLLLVLVGVSLFGSSAIGFLLFFTHILACLTVGFFFRFWKFREKETLHYNVSKNDNKLQNVTLLNIGEILGESIQSSISTILMIGGFIVLFSVIISILNSTGIITVVSLILEPICSIFGLPTKIASSILTGILEITNGINMISLIKLKNISINIIITAFLLGIGGISVMLQVLSIVSKSDLSIKPYVIGKLLHGTFAALYTFLFINLFPIFNFNL